MELDQLTAPDAVTPTLNDAPAASVFDAVPKSLRAAFVARGFTELSAVQRAVLEAKVEGRDLQISSQTGSGKTVALGFVLAPMLESERGGRGPDALIIVPTRELAAQVCEELSWLVADISGVLIASVTGGTPVYRDRQMLGRKPRVLVGTPGRLLDHVKSGNVDLGNVRELVLDEADQMLDMGFREELEGILDATPKSRRTHMVSATFPDGIQRLAQRYQSEPFSIEGTRLGDPNKDIEHEGHLVRPSDRYAALVNLLLQADGDRTLVFVERRSDALEVAEKLEADGFAALPLSGELAQSQRDRTLAAFREGRANVLVATDVAARGLDVPDVVTVIHTAPSIDAQVYTHRSGRTGRAGKRGRSVLFASPNKRRKVAMLLAQAGVELKWKPVPDAAQVRAQLSARSRAALETDLDTALAAGPSGPHIAHAKELLATRDSAAVVAALLARLEPTRRAEPKDVDTARIIDTVRRPERPERPRRERVGKDRPSHGGDFDRFFINWGGNQGATPSRLLAAICRRGEVDGSAVGSIAVHPNASTFDVRSDLAERFERLAGRRDPRDPKTRIRRDRALEGTTRSTGRKS
jgi:ATP-dependent RNA helicase DeaD